MARVVGADPPYKPVSKRERHMVHVALLVRLDAKPGKEADVANCLRGDLAEVLEGPATNGSGRQVHFPGRVAAALTANASERFARAIEPVDDLAGTFPRQPSKGWRTMRGFAHGSLQHATAFELATVSEART
jgi:hypothetical protein